MSNKTYNEYWIKANEDLKSRLVYESSPIIAPKDKASAFQHIAVLYVKYIQIFKKLETAYDQMVHPQKRRLLKEVVIACLGRLLELRHKMVEIENLDFRNFSDILLDLKLSPDDLKIPIPNFYIEERAQELDAREKLLESLNAKQFSLDKPALFSEIKLYDAIRMIQINERGRQGQLRAKYMKDIRLQAQRENEADEGDDENAVSKAALTIQKVYKGFVARKKYHKMVADELIFLGMAPPPKDSKPSNVQKAELNKERRKALRKQHETEYMQALVNTKEKIMKVEGPDMKEGIQDSFRQWYMEYKRVHGKLPDFPPEEVWQDPNFQFLLPQQVNQAAAAADSNLPPLPEAVKPEDGAAAEKKGAKGAEKNKGAKPGAKKGKGEKEEEVEESFKFDNSEFLTEIKKVQSTYENNWQNKDETENFAQKHDQEIIKILKRKEVEAEIKSSVMEILKEELKNLKSAVEKDSGKGKKKGKGGKGKKSAKGKKKGGKKGGKGKKEKKGKKGGKKGKKEKDLTANRTMESLIEELVQTGILQKVPKLSIDEFKGEHNLFGNLNKSSLIEPTLGELQRLVCEYCILPLGFPVQPVITEQEKEVLPKEQVDTTSLRVPSIPTVMFFGAKGTGKTSLVNAIASEAGAHIFNLTPKNTAGQFVGKPNVTKMVHMVFKVAKAQAPSIIYIDNIELIFAKKIPKDDQTDPKRIKKDLLKNLKSLTNLDRVILIGSTSKPWEAELKVILPIFEKFIFCPKPDYTSRFLIWRDFIQKKIPNITNSINVSLLARMSSGMSTGSISLCCDRAMTNRRMKLLRNRPLVTNEFVDQIINMMPLAPEEDKLFQDWYEKTPMIRKRLAAMVVADPEEDKNKKKQLKAPPKKK